MGTKNISIADEVYQILCKLKRDDESFTELIRRLAHGEDIKIDEFFGVLKHRTEMLQNLQDDVRRIRKQAVARP
ncbi:MAG: antitoxin VapB family protein [Candidatus Bathyarchaeia archaeon]